VKKYLAVLRVKEIVGKAGFFMVGTLFARPEITVDNTFRASHFFLVCLLNGVAIYLINAGLGYRHDAANERLKGTQQLNRPGILTVGFSLAVIALIWIYLFSEQLILPSIIVYMLWTIYSLPKGFKGIPLMGMTCAFVAQLFHFHIGYMAFSHYTVYSIAVSVYFGLLFAGGHALHEVIDHDADQQARLRTSAVTFGRHAVFQLSTVLFAIAAVHLVFIAWYGIIEWKIIAPYLVASCVHFVMLFVNGSEDNDKLFVYRRKYMILYFVATIVVAIVMYVGRV